MTERRHLFLLRHAKSSWDDPTLVDHDRPLAARGRKAAKLMRAYLRREQVRPALVLSSSAVRARQTLELLRLDGELAIERGLYDAGARTLLERLRRVPDDIDSVILIGHFPSIQDLALMLARDGGELARVAEKFPTGALATLEFAAPWSELDTDAAALTGFVKPRDLA